MWETFVDTANIKFAFSQIRNVLCGLLQRHGPALCRYGKDPKMIKVLILGIQVNRTGAEEGFLVFRPIHIFEHRDQCLALRTLAC
jgi:hypothetical protein